MSQPNQSEARALLIEVMGLPPDARAEFLDEACAGDQDLRAAVQALLEVGGETRAVPRADTPTTPAPSRDGTLPAGTLLGPWRIGPLVGRGGMGEVYEAQRADGAFELRAAVKLMKRGLDSEAVVARFLRERRILAKLVHPNIAHPLDAGVAPDGRPFLVMEYVSGEALNLYAEARRLETRDLLLLMLTVCEAAQAAHAQQIVHRDLKPSNVLVTADGQIKLLDFGIAKLLDDGDAEATRLAGESLSFTPAYAAPEQLLGAPASAATDVYALGVILYQLLTGRLPHSRSGESLAALMQAVPAETVERPSAVLRQQRGRLDEPLRQSRLKAVSRDLDLIVMKALHAEPARRYATAGALAADLRRLLEHRPVLARPDSWPYRVGRFTRRNRVLVIAASLLLASLLAGVGATLWQARRAEREAQAALEEAQRVSQTKAFFVSIFTNADPMQRKDSAPQTLQGAFDEAVNNVEHGLDQDPKLKAALLVDLGEIRAGQGAPVPAKAMFQQAYALQQKLLRPDDPALALTLLDLGAVEGYLGRPEQGVEPLKRAVAILQQYPDTESENYIDAVQGLAVAYQGAGEDLNAEAMLKRVLQARRGTAAQKPRDLVVALGNVGALEWNLRHDDEAGKYFEECRLVGERELGGNSPNLLECLDGLMRLAEKRHDAAAALDAAERQLKVARAAFAGDHMWVANALSNAGRARIAVGRRQDGEQLLHDAIAMDERLDIHDASWALTLAALADSRRAAGAPDADAATAAARSACASLPRDDAQRGACRDLMKSGAAAPPAAPLSAAPG